jgi:hypothetical protein
VFFNTNTMVLIMYNVIKILLLNFLVKICLKIRVRLIYRNECSSYLDMLIKLHFFHRHPHRPPHSLRLASYAHFYWPHKLNRKLFIAFTSSITWPIPICFYRYICGGWAPKSPFLNPKDVTFRYAVHDLVLACRARLAPAVVSGGRWSRRGHPTHPHRETRRKWQGILLPFGQEAAKRRRKCDAAAILDC